MFIDLILLRKLIRSTGVSRKVIVIASLVLVYGCGSTPVGDKDSGTSIPARSTGTRSPEEQASVISQMEAQIRADAERYAKGRPRKQFLGARVPEPRFAAYLKEWVARIEQIGNANYPAEARGSAMSRSVLNEVGVTARGWSCYATFR